MSIYAFSNAVQIKYKGAVEWKEFFFNHESYIGNKVKNTILAVVLKPVTKEIVMHHNPLYYLWF